MTTKFDFIEEDRRIMEQKVRRHQLSQQEFQKIVKNLPNDEEHGEPMGVLENTEILEEV